MGTESVGSGPCSMTCPHPRRASPPKEVRSSACKLRGAPCMRGHRRGQAEGRLVRRSVVQQSAANVRAEVPAGILVSCVACCSRSRRLRHSYSCPWVYCSMARPQRWWCSHGWVSIRALGGRSPWRRLAPAARPGGGVETQRLRPVVLRRAHRYREGAGLAAWRAAPHDAD